MGNEAAAEVLLHGFAVRYPDSIFDAQAPELEATVLLAKDNAAGAQRVLAAAANGLRRTGPDSNLRMVRVAQALGRRRRRSGIFKQVAAGASLCARRRRLRGPS